MLETASMAPCCTAATMVPFRHTLLDSAAAVMRRKRTKSTSEALQDNAQGG